MIKVTVSGAAEFEAFIAKLPAAIEKAADMDCALVAEMTAARARQLVPVRTGTLQRSIEVKNPAPMVYTVGSEVSYAPFVEFGTSRMMAKPFLRPAAAELAPQLGPLLKDKLLEALYGW